MSEFEQTAAELFEAAGVAADNGAPSGEWTVLVSRQGGVTLLSDPTWSLSSLAGERGAEMAYRISRRGTNVRLEGRCGTRSCVMVEEKTRATLLNTDTRPLDVMPASELTEALPVRRSPYLLPPPDDDPIE